MINNYLYQRTLWKKLHVDAILLFFIFILLTYSMLILWSASSKNISIIEHKIIQSVIGVFIMLMIARIPPHIYEIWAPHLYVSCIFLLILVKFFGQINKGSQRWINLIIFHFQPSEIVKVAIPLMISRFINRNEYPLSFKNTIFVIILIFFPSFLIAIQPDLGTALLTVFSGFSILFLSGISWQLITIMIFIVSSFIPVLWFFFMYDYQKNRIIMLLNPEIDPLGYGYHIIQSKIAIGSGGWLGKGWLHGTQSQLEFLPEKHTDFIFAVLGEELGFIGIILLIFLYLGLIIRGLIIASQAKNNFGQVMIASFMLALFFYIFVNIGMVSGILPIVGVPLPLISYGGSAFTTFMIEFGMIMSIHTHKKILSRNP